jgi:hypothetical protein
LIQIILAVCTNKGPGPLQRGDNCKNTKIGWGHLNIFSGTNDPEKLRFARKLPDIM